MNQPASKYPLPGEILDGKYRVEKLLGEGGMGAVARATHLLLHRIVAVKFMNPQFMSFPGAVERFLNEGRASGAIKSDHVVPVSDVGCLPSGTPYLVMECLYGLDLADLLARDGPAGLPVERAVHFTVQILRGLQAAHAIGIIHRDMKPSNCFVVTQDGEEDFVKILDFGISKIAQPGSASLTQTNSALGTPLYMSPEQARSPRDVDARSDLYSVGVILYELLSGRTPFFSESGEFTEILFQLFTTDPPPVQKTRSDLPEALALVVHKALSREVPDRYDTALDFAEALVPFAAAPTIALVDRMRAFKPPSHQSLLPIEGLPTSMAAFSQLQRGQGTDLMANRPRTDVQRDLPGTEMLANAPAAAPRTAVLAMTPAEALGRTQLQPDAPRPESRQASRPGVDTDLGASRDAAVASGTRKRPPFIYALPVFAVGIIAVGASLAFRKHEVAVSPPPPASTVPPIATPPAIPTPIVSAAASASSASSASTASSAPPAVVSAPPPKRPAVTPRPTDNVLNRPLQQ
jgi:eukaryotic-like serine/threonine-protein kinase